MVLLKRLASTPAMFNSTMTKRDDIFCPVQGAIMITGEWLPHWPCMAQLVFGSCAGRCYMFDVELNEAFKFLISSGLIIGILNVVVADKSGYFQIRPWFMINCLTIYVWLLSLPFQFPFLGVRFLTELLNFTLLYPSEAHTFNKVSLCSILEQQVTFRGIEMGWNSLQVMVALARRTSVTS